MIAFQHLKTMRSAAKNGFFFPNRQAIQEAPLGSQELPTYGSIWKRLTSEVGWFRISQHKCPFPNIKRPIRILHLTDIHIHNHSPWLKHLCAQIEHIQADIVAITGDVVTRGWSEEAVHAFLKACPKGKMATK